MPHRAKHRKEVKKYLRKKAAKETRDAAEDRDNRLFLFSDAQQVQKLTSRSESSVGDDTNESAGESADSIPIPVPEAPLQRRSSTSCYESEGKPSATSTAGGVSESAASASNITVGEENVGEWDFDFVFRTNDLKTGKDLAEVHDDPAAQDVAHVSDEFYRDAQADEAAEGEGCEAYECSGACGTCLDCVHVPDTTSALTSQHKITSTLHVRYIDAVPPLPMVRPLSIGTNLNAPTQNFMTVDCEHNLHQFSPGFKRDRAVAMRSIFGAAVKEWNEQPPKDSTVIVSTGDAIRSIFEQAYSSKPMGLFIRRVGPTLVIESRTSDPTDVHDLRAQSLLGKALYRIHEGVKAAPTTTNKAPSVGDATASSSSSNNNNTPRNEKDHLAVRVVEKACGIVSLPPVRVGSAVIPRCAPSINRYSQTLLWEIDKLEILVGVDTPIVVDEETRSRSMVRLEDASTSENADEMQRELLNCWFDATLANVPQVGVYVHKDGIIQQYELKKVQELLGLVEGRIATAAMSFTSNVLQWIVRYCAVDGGTYAVVRDFDSDYLELYEQSADAPVPQQLADPTDAVCDDAVEHDPLDPSEADGCTARERAERQRVNVDLARMCLAMGSYLLKQDGGREKAEKASTLLLRALAIFLRYTAVMDVRKQLAALTHLLPELALQLVGTRRGAAHRSEQPTENGHEDSQSHAPFGAPREESVTTPDYLRHVLITCSKFETRIRQADRRRAAEKAAAPGLRGDNGDDESSALMPLLIPCSAALCVVVARTLEIFTVERAMRARLKRGTSASARPLGKCRQTDSTDQPDSLHAEWKARCAIARDYLQVAAEGLLRLEHLSQGISRYYGEQTSEGACAVPKEDAAMAEKDGICDAISALTCPKQQLNSCCLTRALCELYGDVVLLCLSDSTPFTVDVLHDIAKRIMAREAARHVPQSTTLSWMCALTADRVSLSVTALRLYKKAGSHFKRHIIKVAQVYYYVGLKYFHDSRFTKALEALRQSLSLFDAGQTAPCDEELGECFLGAGVIDMAAVQRALGDTHSRMAAQEMRVQLQGIALSVEQATTTSTPGAKGEGEGGMGRGKTGGPTLPRMTVFQPLAIGPARPLCKTEEVNALRATEAYQRAGWSADKARILTHHVAARVSAVCVTGVPLRRHAASRLYDMLKEARQLNKDVLHEYRELQLMRLFTATHLCEAPDALVQEVEAAVRAWEVRSADEGQPNAVLCATSDSHTATSTTSCGCGPLIALQDANPALLSHRTELEDERGLTVTDVKVTQIERDMQLALVSLVMAATRAAWEATDEHTGGKPNVMSVWGQRCLAYLAKVLLAFDEHAPNPRPLHSATASTSADEGCFSVIRLRVAAVCWGSLSVRWWVLRVVHMILVRLDALARVADANCTSHACGPKWRTLKSVPNLRELANPSPPATQQCQDCWRALLEWVKAAGVLV